MLHGSIVAQEGTTQRTMMLKTEAPDLEAAMPPARLGFSRKPFRGRAAEGGHLSVLQWAHANGCPWP
jgi:hypothetical protein